MISEREQRMDTYKQPKTLDSCFFFIFFRSYLTNVWIVFEKRLWQNCILILFSFFIQAKRKSRINAFMRFSRYEIVTKSPVIAISF